MLEGVYCKWIFFLIKVIFIKSIFLLFYKYIVWRDKEYFFSILLFDLNIWEIINV